MAEVFNAEHLANNRSAQEHCSSYELKSAALILSSAGRHSQAAILLRHMRNFSVTRDLIKGMLTKEDANALSEESAIELGLQLEFGQKIPEAWDALFEALSQYNVSNKPLALESLARVAVRLASMAYDPARQVQALMRTIEVDTILNVLPPQKRSELEATLLQIRRGSRQKARLEMRL